MALEPITRQEKIIAGQDLTPITRMEMFLKNFGGGGGGSVPKPLTYDYMPDGYPYKEQETILDGTFEFADGGGVYMHQIADEGFTIVDGKSYTIIWDVETYQCVATDYSGLPILGNLAVVHAGSDTG